MALIRQLAQRSVFRNKRRTLLTTLLIGFGLAALIFANAFLQGMLAHLVKISTDTFLGEVQIHQPQFRADQDAAFYIADYQNLLEQLQISEEVSTFSPRTLTGGMISSSQNVSAGLVYGIQPAFEAELSKLENAMIEGNFLSGERGEVLLGKDLADLLEVELGDRIVITASNADNGEISQALFRLSGTFSFNDRQMDGGMAFINLEDSQNLLAINGIHEIAIKLQPGLSIHDNSLALWSLDDELEILGWNELLPQLYGVLEMSDISKYIMASILYILVGLGLVNSMFMSIYERHHEFGILLSIGSRPAQIFKQILCEGFILGLMSVVTGLIAGVAITVFFMHHGIDYSGTELMGITLNDPVYPIMDIQQILLISASILGFTILACVYPAFHAARLKPSLAMKKTL